MKKEDEIVKTLESMRQALGNFVQVCERTFSIQDEQMELQRKQSEILEAELKELEQKGATKDHYEDYRKNVSHFFGQAKNYATLIVFAIYATFFSLWWSLGEDDLPNSFKKAGLALIVSAVTFGLYEILSVFWQSFKFLRDQFKNTKKQSKNKEQEEQKDKKEKPPLPLGLWASAAAFYFSWTVSVMFGLYGVLLMGRELFYQAFK